MEITIFSISQLRKGKFRLFVTHCMLTVMFQTFPVVILKTTVNSSKTKKQYQYHTSILTLYF